MFSGYYENIEFDNQTGEIILDGIDRLKIIDIYNFDTAKNKPVIYNGIKLQGEVPIGSLYISDDNSVIEEFNGDSWEVVFRDIDTENGVELFEIDEWDVGVSYPVRYPVYHNGKKYISTVDGTTVGLSPAGSIVEDKNIAFSR